MPSVPALRVPVLGTPEILAKLSELAALEGFDGLKTLRIPTGLRDLVPLLPARDVAVVEPHLLPPKLPLQSVEGVKRLMHDLANIELQAMELGLRSLLEFPDMPAEMRDELWELTCAEGKHLSWCLNSLRELGGEWGDYPVHLSLWNATSREDSLLERVFIVHCFLEGSGLDAGDVILKRIHSGEPLIKKAKGVVSQIVQEEEDHVRFGLKWFEVLCRDLSLDRDLVFAELTHWAQSRSPKREKLSHDRRLRAGFSLGDLARLEERREIKT